ncbi:hypothetical protein [Chitinophaga nivalis]|uniref:Uncharacterized protein n=1 Tax=Chitinophaga nivalis TaxID=2991709 RepID=A0ABT3IHE7_9BACT|nr:hypothetical protein [Chitinophaga nivalis]MCW3466921.1 hypothetical protein [Chitinophaga nivalis]MCW3483388.1 hypothetical protein [Chitinophaga nivalis]
MAIKKRKETTDLTVIPASEVSLTITIGNAQIGASVVRSDANEQIIAKGDIRNLKLGKAEDIRGKTLKVTTNILDSNTLTNGMVVTCYFESCKPNVVVFQDEVKSDGDILSFLLDFNFR